MVLRERVSENEKKHGENGTVNTTVIKVFLDGTVTVRAATTTTTATTAAAATVTAVTGLSASASKKKKKSSNMLGRKQSIKGEPVLADYGPEESLNESADIEWVNKVPERRRWFLNISLVTGSLSALLRDDPWNTCFSFLFPVPLFPNRD